MSAFSRGLLLQRQCQFTPISLQNSFRQAGTLSSSRILRAATKTKIDSKTAKSILQDKQLPSITKAGKNYHSYADVLASKSHTTLLYQAPSHTGLFIACYGTSAFCLSYAGFSYYANFVNAPADLAWWVPVAFSGICLLMACAGGWVLQTPRGIVRSITAIPKSLHVPVGKGAFPTDLQIEIELKKMFPVPFFPARKLYIQPSEMKFPSLIVPPETRRFSATEVAQMKALEAEERRRQWEFDQSNIMTSPFRHMSRALFGAFKAMKQSWAREGFMRIQAKGQFYKMDISDGWALDGGKALDRLTTRAGV